MGVNDQASAGNQQAATELARLSEEYFDVAHRADPFGATQVGASGFDALVPDPSRAGAAHDTQQIARVEDQLSRIDVSELDQAGRENYAGVARARRVLGRGHPSLRRGQPQWAHLDRGGDPPGHGAARGPPWPGRDRGPDGDGAAAGWDRRRRLA